MDAGYFERDIRPMLTGEIEFVGEIAEEEKDEFLGGAAAVLFPIDWPEPFGLVMIEAAARGTPVLAYRRGSVREVIDEGVTGMVVEDADQAVAALPTLLGLPRAERPAGGRGALLAWRGWRSEYVEVYGRLMASARREDAAPLAIGGGQPMITTRARGHGRLGDHERRHGPGRGAGERLTCHLPSRCGCPRRAGSARATMMRERWAACPDLRARRTAL